VTGAERLSHAAITAALDQVHATGRDWLRAAEASAGRVPVPAAHLPLVRAVAAALTVATGRRNDGGPDHEEDAVSDRIPPHNQGRWQDQRGRRGTRGPNRVPRHPLLPLPDEVPAADEITEFEEDEMPQKDPSGSGGGIGGPKAPPAAPRTPPPPPPPPSE
jgi:hypothetical protein